MFSLLSFLFTIYFSHAALNIVGGENIDLGEVIIGKSKTTTIVLQNSGSERVILDTIYLGFTFKQIMFLDKDFPGTGGTCTDWLEALQSCTFIVSFSPNTVDKIVSTFVKFSYTSGSTPQSLQLTLSGKGIAESDLPEDPTVDPGILALNVDVINFGLIKVGTTSTRVLQMTNVGNAASSAIQPLPLSGPFAFPGEKYPGTAGTCGAILYPQENCQFLLEFHPTIPGHFTSNVVLEYFDGDSLESIELKLIGTAK